MIQTKTNKNKWIQIDNINQFTNKLSELQHSINSIINSIQTDLKTIQTDCNINKIEEKQNEDLRRKYKRYETYSDQLNETEKRCKNINKYENQIIEYIKTTQKQFELLFTQFKQNELLIHTYNSSILEQLKRIESEMIDEGELVGDLFAKTALMKEKKRSERIEIQQMRYNTMRNYFLNVDQLIQFEEWTGLWIDEIIFDSSIHNWKQKTSEFDDLIKGKKNVFIIVKTNENDIFGGFISKSIATNNKHTVDNKAFIFSFPNGFYGESFKFEILGNAKALKVCDKKSDVLFEFGNGEICIKKHHPKNKSTVIGSILRMETKKESLAFKQKKIFVKNVLVLQMAETEKQRKAREYKTIEEILNKSFGQKIFDTNYNPWKQTSTLFVKRLLKCSKLLFMIDLEDGTKIGGYVNSTINNVDEYVRDKKSLLFVASKKDIFEFDVDCPQQSFILYDEDDQRFFQFGDDNIVIMKQFVDKPSWYDMKNEVDESMDEYDIIPKQTSCKPKRIRVYQMMSPENERQNEENVMIELENYTNKVVDEVLFDSDADEWSVDQCDFNKKILNKEHVLIRMETDKNVAFGYYMENKITTLGMNTDRNGFLYWFFENKLKIVPMIPKTRETLNLIEENSSTLFELGHKTIIIGKENCKSVVQYDNSNKWIETKEVEKLNIVVGNMFKLKNIKVYKMKPNEMMKKKTIERKKQIETLTKLSFDKCIFDSNIDSFDQENSVFNKKVKNKSNLLFLIYKDEMNGIGLVSKRKIEKFNKPISDKGAIVFTFSDETLLQYKFIKSKRGNDYQIFSSGSKQLMTIGREDVVINKDGFKSSIYQNEESSLNYNGKQNALIGKVGVNCFVPYKIEVYQMKNLLDQNQVSIEEHMKKFEEILEMKQKCILFDSEQDNWKIRSSVFGNQVINKPQIVIMIETMNNKLFGVYLSDEIEKYEEYIQYAHSFMFSVTEENEIEIYQRKYEGKNVFKLYKSNNEKLFEIGNEEIIIYKEGKSSTYQYNENSVFHYQNYDQYENEINEFIPKRIVVYQFEESIQQMNERINYQKERNERIIKEQQEKEENDKKERKRLRREKRQKEKEENERKEKEKLEQERKEKQKQIEISTTIPMMSLNDVTQSTLQKKSKLEDLSTGIKRNIKILKSTRSECQNEGKEPFNSQYHDHFNDLNHLFIENKTIKFPTSLQNQLTEWTGKTVKGILFDSAFDSFEVDNSSFDKNVFNKSNLVFVVQTEEGYMYGCYIHTKIDIINDFLNDSKAFAFSFVPNTMIYPIGEKWKKKFSFKVCNESDSNLFYIGTDIVVGKAYHTCLCLQNVYCSYSYGTIENALIGRSNESGEHVASRIVVLQLE